MSMIIKNRVKVQGDKEKIKDFKKYMEGPTSRFDFNKIMKMPDRLHKVQSLYGMYYLIYKNKITLSKDDAERVRWFERLSEQKQKEFLKEGTMALRNIIDYGSPSWCEWSTYNWGCRSNAIDVCWDDDEGICYFTTELTPPYLIYKKMDDLFPDFSFEFSYYDDDFEEYTTLDNETIKDPFEVREYTVKMPKAFLWY